MATSRTASLEVRIAANISDFERKMTRALQVTRGFVDVMEQIDRSARGLGGGLDQAEAAQRKFTAGITGANRKLDELGDSSLRVERQLSDTNSTLSRLAGSAERVENALQPLPGFLSRYNAELSDTRQASQQTAQSMELVIKQLTDIKAALNTSPASYQRAERGIRSLQRTSQGAQSQIRGVGDASKRSQNFLFSFGAAAEDSAFGFRGLANNIPLVIRDFQFLRQEAGGATGALKSIATGLASPGGLIAILGIASSVIITFGDDLVKAFSTAADEFKTLRTDIESAIDEVANFDSGVLGVQFTPENIDQAVRETSDAIAQAVQGESIEASLLDAGLIRQIILGEGDEALKDVEKELQSFVKNARSAVGISPVDLQGSFGARRDQAALDRAVQAEKERRRTVAQRVTEEAQLLKVLGEQLRAFELQRRQQDRLAERGGVVTPDDSLARLQEDIDALNQSAIELSRNLNLSGDLGTVERQAAALAEAFKLDGDLGTERVIRENERINNAIEAQTERRLQRKENREETVARRALAAQEEAIRRVEQGYNRIYSVIQGNFSGLLNSVVNTDTLISLFGGGGDNRDSLRLQQFRLREEEEQLRESLANRTITYEEYQLRVEELNSRIAQTQSRLARATEGTFQRVFRSIAQFVKGVVDGIIREINRAIARVIALRVIRAVSSPFASFLGGGGGAGQIISNPGFTTSSAPTQIVGVVEGDSLRLVTGRAEQNTASSGQLSLG